MTNITQSSKLYRRMNCSIHALNIRRLLVNGNELWFDIFDRSLGVSIWNFSLVRRVAAISSLISWSIGRTAVMIFSSTWVVLLSKGTKWTDWLRSNWSKLKADIEICVTDWLTTDCFCSLPLLLLYDTLSDNKRGS